MNNISLNQFHVCESNYQIAYKKINCKHWTVTENDCKEFCTLKNINCNKNVCGKCSEREPLKIDPAEKSKKTHPFVQEMKDKFPQYNAYKKEMFEQEKEKTFAEKAKSYAKAESSQMVQGKVSKKIYEKRKSICMSCEYRVDTAKNNTDEVGWCKGGCGCSVGNPRAALSQKLYMPTLSCPKGKFGEEKGEGFNMTDAIDSVKGIIKSVKNLFEKDK